STLSPMYGDDRAFFASTAFYRLKIERYVAGRTAKNAQSEGSLSLNPYVVRLRCTLPSSVLMPEDHLFTDRRIDNDRFGRNGWICKRISICFGGDRLTIVWT